MNESKQVGILYHYTRKPSDLINILKDNKLKASIHNQYYKYDDRYLTKTKRIKKRNGVILSKSNPIRPHISFTRVKEFNRRTAICLTMDGNKLSNNYKISPYSMGFYDRTKSNSVRFVGHSEFEERIYSDILNLDDYIIDIDIDLGSIITNLTVYYHDFNKELGTYDKIKSFNKLVNEINEIRSLYPYVNIYGEYDVDNDSKSNEYILNKIKELFPEIKIKYKPPFDYHNYQKSYPSPLSDYEKNRRKNNIIKKYENFEPEEEWEENDELNDALDYIYNNINDYYAHFSWTKFYYDNTMKLISKIFDSPIEYVSMERGIKKNKKFEVKYDSGKKITSMGGKEEIIKFKKLYRYMRNRDASKLPPPR